MSTTLDANQMSNAALADEVFAEARTNAGTVRYWDATNDPANPGWMIRTYDADGDYTDEMD